MRRERASLVTMGIPSLFLIFSVLCLVILALLTLGTSRSDLSTSRRSIDQTSSYYDICASATELCQKAEAFLMETRSASRNAEEYFEQIAQWEEAPFQWSADTGRLHFQLPFSDTQELIVELEALFPEKEGDSCMKIVLWKTGTIGTWNPDTKQPVYKKESANE